MKKDPIAVVWIKYEIFIMMQQKSSTKNLRLLRISNFNATFSLIFSAVESKLKHIGCPDTEAAKLRNGFITFLKLHFNFYTIHHLSFNLWDIVEI